MENIKIIQKKLTKDKRIFELINDVQSLTRRELLEEIDLEIKIYKDIKINACLLKKDNFSERISLEGYLDAMISNLENEKMLQISKGRLDKKFFSSDYIAKFFNRQLENLKDLEYLIK